MYLLALNTATQRSGAALIQLPGAARPTTGSTPPALSATASNRLLAEKSWLSRANDSEKMLPALFALLKSHQLQFSDVQGILVITGPGSFTSLRVGVTVANALAFSLKCPVYALDTFSLLQKQIKSARLPKSYIFINAGRDQIYVHTISSSPSKYAIWSLPDFLKEIKTPTQPLYYYAELSAPQQKVFRELKPRHLHAIPQKDLFTFGQTIAKMNPVELEKLRLKNFAEPFYHRKPDITLSKKPIFS